MNVNNAFYLCDTVGFLRVMYFIRLALNIIRYVVPIIVIVMIVMDLLKNVINPNEKEGIKKITNRLVAAVVVFLIPTIVNIIVYFIDLIFENGSTTNYKVSNCYTNATMSCINKIDDYLNCVDTGLKNTIGESEELKQCKAYRQCNSYTLNSSCNVSTELDDYRCSNYNNNEKIDYSKYKR